MSQPKRKKSRGALSDVIDSALEGMVPLTRTLRERGIPRSTFYRHAEIPRAKRGGRVYVSGSAIDAFIAQREKGQA